MLAEDRAAVAEQVRLLLATEYRDEPTLIRNALSSERVPAVRSSLEGRRVLSASAQAVLRGQAAGAAVP